MLASLRSRLWFSYAILVAIVLGIAFLASLWVLREIPLRQASSRVQTVTQFLEQQQILESQFLTKFFLQRMANALNARIIWLDKGGDPLMDSQPDEPPFPRPDLVIQPRIIPPSSTRMARDTGGTLWLFNVIELDGGGYIITAVPRPLVRLADLVQDELLPPLLNASLLALFIALLLSIIMSRWITTPLYKMVQGTLSVAEGDFKPIPVQGPEEVRQLSSAFNAMAQRVTASQRAQRDFVANVSHELKTPLTSIQGFAQALVDGTVDSPEGTRQAAEIIQEEANRMHRLVLDLLELARFDSQMAKLEFSAIRLDQLLQQVREIFEPQAQQKEIRIEIDCPPLSIMGDGYRIAQVFTNLVDNALKYSPTGGVVKILAAQVSGWIEVSVQDNGPGISSEDQVRIFERFYQVDPARSSSTSLRPDGGRGAGLGLAIAWEIIQVHGGSIQVQSPIPADPTQRGSIFVVKFPETNEVNV